MKLSLSWIKDYVDLPSTLDTKQLSYDLTMRTVEVEGAENLADRFENIIVGKILSIAQHPNADKLRICTTDIGGETKEIVCGGINLYEGMKVCVSKPGAIVKWHGEGEPVVIKNAKLRGVESYGMICASVEVGLVDLFPAKEEAEVMDLSAFDAADRIMEFSVSSATVALAAAALGTEEARIAKTLSFEEGNGCVLIVCAGDAKIDNRKYKSFFGKKAKMLTPDKALELTGHAVGGVCPFALPDNVPVYLDESLQRFDTVFPAAGTANSAVRLSPEELFRFSQARQWVDVCKLPEVDT